MSAPARQPAADRRRSGDQKTAAISSAAGTKR